jgi:hypothetical protein
MSSGNGSYLYNLHIFRYDRRTSLCLVSLGKGAFSLLKTCGLHGRCCQLVWNAGRVACNPAKQVYYIVPFAQELRGLFCICPCFMPWILVWYLKRRATKMRNVSIGIVLQKLTSTLIASCKFNDKVPYSKPRSPYAKWNSQ